jgi:glutamate-1-semialdehyde aminotransferase
VALAPGAYEALFPSLAHSDEVIDETISIAVEAAEAVVAGLG